MPVLDGYNATRAIRKDEDRNVREVLVIAMTASAIRGDREKCLEAGMNDYLAKPVRQTALKEMLNEYLTNTRSAQHAISSLSNTVPTPGDKVNKETAKVPIKATTPAKESTEREKGLSSKPSASSDSTAGKDGSTAKTSRDRNPSPSAPTNGEKSTREAEQSLSTKPANEKNRTVNGSTPTETASEKNKVNGEIVAPTLNPDQKQGDSRTTSPPSGVKEQLILGKVSRDVISPPENGPTKEEIENQLAKTTSEQRRNEAAGKEDKTDSPEIKVTPPPNDVGKDRRAVQVSGS